MPPSKNDQENKTEHVFFGSRYILDLKIFNINQLDKRGFSVSCFVTEKKISTQNSSFMRFSMSENFQHLFNNCTIT